MRFLILFITALVLTVNVQAQKTRGGDIGVGFVFGDPTGASMNYFLSNKNSIDAFLGTSYFGEISIGGDYLWYFNAFNSKIVHLYTGPGVVLGFGDGKGILSGDNKDKDKFYNRDEGIGLGARGIMGVSVVPRNSQFQIFAELGLLMGLVPDLGLGLDAGVGFRYYF